MPGNDDLDLSYLIDPVGPPPDGPQRVRQTLRRRRERRAGAAAFSVLMLAGVGALLMQDEAGKRNVNVTAPSTTSTSRKETTTTTVEEVINARSAKYIGTKFESFEGEFDIEGVEIHSHSIIRTSKAVSTDYYVWDVHDENGNMLWLAKTDGKGSFEVVATADTPDITREEGVVIDRGFVNGRFVSGAVAIVRGEAIPPRYSYKTIRQAWKADVDTEEIVALDTEDLEIKREDVFAVDSADPPAGDRKYTYRAAGVWPTEIPMSTLATIDAEIHISVFVDEDVDQLVMVTGYWAHAEDDFGSAAFVERNVIDIVKVPLDGSVRVYPLYNGVERQGAVGIVKDGQFVRAWVTEPGNGNIREVDPDEMSDGTAFQGDTSHGE